MPGPSANFAIPNRYRIGCGRRAELAREARSLGVRRGLVVSDPGVAALPWHGETLDGARADGLELHLHTGVRSNPTEENVSAGVALYRREGCDGVIAFGGGSAMDAAKCIALMVGHEGSIFDYEFARGGHKRIRAEAMPPLLALPTTAGTGSECSTGAVVTDAAAGVKRTLLHFGTALLPRAVIADPEVTFDLPPEVTAATGMDAVTHCFEAYFAPGYHPMAEGIALEGLRLLAENLPRCASRPRDAEARTHALMASSMAAVAFQKGLGLVHAMAHPLGAVTDIHHGLANGILLPYVARENREHLPAEKLRRLARILELAGDDFDAVLGWLLELRETLGVPRRLRGVAGIDSADLAAELAPKALAEKVYLATNPAPVTEEQIRRVYERAIEGA